MQTNSNHRFRILTKAKITEMVNVNVFLIYNFSVISESNTLVLVMLLRPAINLYTHK